MKPRTKLQLKVTESSAKLKLLSNKDIKYAYKQLSKYFVSSRKTIYCLECGYHWKTSITKQPIKTCCPSCHSTLKPSTWYKGHYEESFYHGVITTMGDMQITRVFLVQKYMRKKQAANYSMDEVMQHWITEKGKITSMSKDSYSLSPYKDSWIINSELNVKPNSFQGGPKFNINPYSIDKHMKVLPVLERNGFKGDFHDINPPVFFSRLLSKPRFETMLKAGQVDLMKHFVHYESRMEKYWKSIKTCIRNNYLVEDAITWLDHLELLEHFGKDITSPRHVCPLNLKIEHDKLILKRTIQRKREHVESLKKKIEEEQTTYAQEKSKFLGIKFQDSNITIMPLQSIEDFLKEGDILNHCVFINEYYKKPGSLVLSARVGDTRVETVEVSLPDQKILQSRGKHNLPSEYHEQVINLVNQNMEFIANIAKKGV